MNACRRSFCSISKQAQQVHEIPSHIQSGTIVPGTINVSHAINDLRHRKLHKQPSNPICIIKNEIFQHFADEYGHDNESKYVAEDSLSEVVTCQANFDDLLIPDSHPSKSLSDTFYLDDEHILRPHTSAHQTQMLRQGHKQFLVCGDCYRKDTIDATHYPVFHQMEGLRVFHRSEGLSKRDIEADLKATLVKLVVRLFGDACEYEWMEDYFPFTDPSFEMEVNGLEIFGSGIIRDEILLNCGLTDYDGWAFGLGLERLAMILFEITDVRQFWSTDDRFLSQYADGKIRPFVPYSKFPVCYKDISFWIAPESGYHSHEFMDIVRNVAGDIVESVQLVDEYECAQTKRLSHCYRVSYRHNDRTLTNQEINCIQQSIAGVTRMQLNVEIRG